MKQSLSIFWVIVAALLLTSTATYAQFDTDPVVVYDPDENDRKIGFDRSKVVIGGFGTLGFGTNNYNDPFYGVVPGNSFTYGGTPFVGYRFLSDRWISGLGFNILSDNVRLRPGGTTDIPVINYTTYGGRVLTRFLLFHIGDPAGVYAQAEFERMRGVEKYKLNGEVLQKTTIPGQSAVLLGLGYSSNYYQGFGFNAEVFVDVLNRQSGEPIWSGIIPRFGFTYGF